MIRKILFWAITILVLMASLVYAQSCSDGVKANQYVLDGEHIEYYGIVKIENNDYCVFKYNNHDSSYSEVIILDKSNNRLDEKNLQTLQEAILSYKTLVYLEDKYVTIQPVLQAIYDDLIQNSHQYNSKLGEIRQAVKIASQFIKVDIPIYGALKLDVIKALEYLVFDGAYTDWNGVLYKYKGYKETIDQMSVAKQKGYISYNEEVKVFYKDSIAIENFVKILDDKTNSGVSTKFASLSFTSRAQQISDDSVNEINLIKNRVDKKKSDAIAQKNFIDFTINSFGSTINKALSKNINVTNYKKEYCNLKRGLPDTLLIDREMFQDYIEKADKIKIEIEARNNELDKKLEDAPNRFFLQVWVDKLIWFFKKSC